MDNLFTNTTDRNLKLGGNAVAKPGDFALNKDAMHVVKRPLFQSYLSDGSIKSRKAPATAKQKLTTQKTPATEKQKLTSKTDTSNGSAGT